MSAEEQFFILKHKARRSRILLPPNIRKPMHHERLVLTFAPFTTSFGFKRTTKPRKYLPEHFHFHSLNKVGVVLKLNEEKNENSINSFSIVETRAVLKNNPENVKNEQCITKGEGEKGHNKLLEEFSHAKSQGNCDPFSLPPFAFGKNFEQDSVPSACCDLLDDVVTAIRTSSTADAPIISSTHNVDLESVKSELCIAKGGKDGKGFSTLLKEVACPKSHENFHPSFSALPTFNENFQEDSIPKVCHDLLDGIVTSISASSTSYTPIFSSTRDAGLACVKNEQCIAREDGKRRNMLLEEVFQPKSHANVVPLPPALPTFSKKFEESSVLKGCHDVLDGIITVISKSTTPDIPIISFTLNRNPEFVKNEQGFAERGDGKKHRMFLEEVTQSKSYGNFDPSFSASSTFGENNEEDSIPKVCHDLLHYVNTAISKSSTVDDTPIVSSTHIDDFDCVKNEPHIVEGNGQRNGVLLEKNSQPRSHENFAHLFSALSTFDGSFEEDSIPKVCRDLLSGIISAISEFSTSDTLIILPTHDNHECTKNKQNVAKGGDRKKHFMHLQDVSQPKSHGNLDPLLSLSPTFSEKFDEDSIPKMCRDLLYDIINEISESSAGNGTVADLDCVKNEPRVAKGNGQRHGILLEEVSHPKNHENFVPSLPTFGENFKEDSIPKMCHDLLDDIITSISESLTSDTPIISPAHNDHKSSEDKLHVSTPSGEPNEITFIPDIPLQRPGYNRFFALVPIHPKSLSSVNAQNGPDKQQFYLVVLNKFAPTNSEGEMKSKQPGNDSTTTSKAAIVAKIHCGTRTWPAKRYNPTKFSIDYVHPRHIHYMQNIAEDMMHTYDELPASYNKTTQQNQLTSASHGLRASYNIAAIQRRLQTSIPRVLCTAQIPASFNKTIQQRLLTSTSPGLCIVQLPASCNKTQELLTSVLHGPHLKLKCSLIKIGPFKFQANHGSPFLIANVTSTNISFQALKDTVILKPPDIEELICCISPSFPLILIDVTAKCADDLCDEKVIPRNPALRTAWKNQRRIIFLITYLNLDERDFLGKVVSSASFRTSIVTKDVANDLLFKKPAQTEIKTPDNQIKTISIWAPLSQLPPTRPWLPPTRPWLPPTRPQLPPTRPQLPPTRPQLPPTRPQLPPTRPQLPPTRPQLPPWQLLSEMTFSKPLLLPEITVIPSMKESAKQGHLLEKVTFDIKANTLGKQGEIRNIKNCMKEVTKDGINSVEKTSNNPNLSESRIEGNSDNFVSFKNQLNNANISRSEENNNSCTSSAMSNQNAVHHVDVKQEEDANEISLREVPKVNPDQVFRSVPAPVPLLLSLLSQPPKVTIPVAKEYAKQKHHPEKAVFCAKPNMVGKTSDIDNVRNFMEKTAKEKINFVKKSSSNPNLSKSKVDGNSKTVFAFKSQLNKENISSEQEHGFLVNRVINSENSWQHVYIKHEEDATETNSPEIPKAKPHQVLASDSILQLPSPQIPLSTNTVTIPAKHFVITEASEKQRNLPENDLFSIKLNTVRETSDILNAKNCVEKIAEGGINFLNKFSSCEHSSGGQAKENLKNVISSKNLLDNVNTSRHGNNTNSLVNVEMNNANDLQHVYIKQEDVNIGLDENFFSDSSKFNSTNVVEEEHFGHSVSGVRIKVEDDAHDLFFPEDYREAMKEDNFSKRFIHNVLCDTDIMEVEKVTKEIQSRKIEEEKVPEVERAAESERVFQNPIRNIYDYEKCLKNNNLIPQCNMSFSDENRINTNRITTEADTEKWSNVNSNNVNDISSSNSGCNAQISIKEQDGGIFSVEDYGEENKQHILKCHIEKYMKDILPLKNTFNKKIEDGINAEVNPSSSAPNPPVCMQGVSIHMKSKTSRSLASEKSCNNNNIADSVKLRKRTCCNNEKYPKPKLKRKLKNHYSFRSIPPLYETVSNKSITAFPSSHFKTVLTDDLGDQMLPHSIHKAPKILKNSTCSRNLKNVEADPTASFTSKENPLKKKRSTLSWSRKARHKLKGRKQGPNFIDSLYHTAKKYKKVNCQLVRHPRSDDATRSLLESSNTHGVNAISKTSLPSIKTSPTNLTSKCKKSNTENSSLPEHTERESCDKHSTGIPHSKTLHSNKIHPSLKLRIKKCANGFKGFLIEDDNLAVDADKLKDGKFCESRSSEQYKDSVCNKTSPVQPIVTKGLSNSKISNSQLRMEKTNNSTHEVRKRLKIDPVITNSFNMSKNVNDCD